MKNKKLYFIAIIVVLILSTIFSVVYFLDYSTNNDVAKNQDFSSFESLVEKEMQSQAIPALSTLVFEEDKVLYENYFGYSNLEKSSNLEKNDLFLVASISKVVTATSLLQLHEDGKFQLDEDINQHLPFEVNIPGYDIDITFRMLLTHTSGIADNDEVMDKHYYYNQDPTMELSYFIENYLSIGGEFYDSQENFFDFEPGSEYEYSNIGTALIAVLVENISGQDFNTYSKENIFAPLGMDDTFWMLGEISQTIVTPYDYLGGENNPIENYTNTDFPNGGLRTTSRDLYKLLLGLFSPDGESKLLNQETVQAMITPQISDIDNRVGLHLFKLDEQNNIWGHDGGEKGVSTIMGFNPETKVGAIILSNQGEADLDKIFTQAYELGTEK